MPALLATTPQLSPLATKWNLLQFVAMPVWYGVGVEIPSLVVVVEVALVLVGVGEAVLYVLECDDDEVGVLLVTSVEEIDDEEVTLDVRGAGFKVDSGTKLTCTK